MNVSKLIEKIESKKVDTFEYFDEYLEEKLTIKKMPIRKLNVILDKADSNSISKSIDVNCELIYESVVDFQSEELKTHFDIKTRNVALIYKIYNDNLGAINKIADFIMANVYGINDEKK